VVEVRVAVGERVEKDQVVVVLESMKTETDDSESEGEVTDAPQPRTVEAMCMANWPAHE
jgi:acetyl/propionyl-CoA carboxylase alpha subunit